MGQTDLKPTAQGQVESSINDTINFIMAKVAAGEIDAATATELIAAARKDYESNVPVTTSAQQAVQLQQTANPYQADPQTAYAVPEMEPEQTPIDYGQFATSTNYPHTYDVEDSSDVDMDALTENAKKKKSAEKSAISVMVTADGAAEDSKASVSVSEKGKNGKIVVKDISVAVNDEVKICTLPKGKYLLTVESAPDGYDKPAKSTSFTVKGDGKKVSAFAFLAKHVDKTAKSGESEDNAEATPADGASQNQDASSDGQNQNNQAENSSADMNRGASAPSSGNGQPSSTSTPTTTKTIHHPAETIRIAICDTCGADITDDIEGHKKSTGHPWYHYDAKVVKEAWDETVTVN